MIKTMLAICVVASGLGEGVLRVPLPGQEENAIKLSWPGIGCWFWTEEEFQADGYKRYVDLHARHSGYGLLTTSIRHSAEVTEAAAHDRIKAAAAYARERGMSVVMDLDVRLARGAFMAKYPDELQEIACLREAPLSESGEVAISVESMNLDDHYTGRTRGYDSVSSRVLRVYSYVSGAAGIDPETVADITDRCRIDQADAAGVRITVPCAKGDGGRTACAIAAFTLFTPDVYGPHLIPFERSILEQYADVALAGACKDEWGFPGRFKPRTDDVWFSRALAEAYTERRPGRDLVRDLLLMVKGERGRELERAAAINHFMEMNRFRNAEVENAFYRGIKEVFGPDAMSATHPTWYPFPTPEEAFKNGMDWWACKRDLAQTDEATPFCARTALAKKWHSPVWYNMYYDSDLGAYAEDLWRHALGGGRMNFHPVYPRETGDRTTSLLRGDLLRADCRVRLLNLISTAPVDCPVAVVFGHPSALNWTGTDFADVGLAVTDGLWAEGFYADLIPSSEIASGALKIGGDGRIQYGPQRYAAAVFYHPQYERGEIADFFRKAGDSGQTALWRVGDWTQDFEGQAFDGGRALPESMRAKDAATCVTEVIALLRGQGIEPQTRSTPRGVAGFTQSMMPNPRGRCRLLDGTFILASGREDVMGDPIRQTINVNGIAASFDAVGVAAVRMDASGKVEAMAAGGLKTFEGGDLTIKLKERTDLALWRNAEGQWQGVIQGDDGQVPEELTGVTRNWTWLRLPERLEAGDRRPEAGGRTDEG